MVTAAFPSRCPYVVAAIDSTHEGRLSRAERLVDAAVGAGCDAVKLTVGGNASGLPPTAVRTLRARCRRRIGVVLGVASVEAAALATTLRPDALQVDPPQLADLPLLRRLARLHMPTLVAVGMCTRATLDAALQALASTPLVLLHTIASAPLAPARARLRTIEWLQRTYDRPVGYLGAEPGVYWALVARALGAIVIEKPLTLDATQSAAHAWSLEPDAMRGLVTRLRDLEQALEPVDGRETGADELDSMAALGLTLVVRRSLRKGARVRASDLTATPPLRGVSPRLLDWVVGRRLLYDLDAGEPITFGMIE